MEGVLSLAREMARAFDAELHLVHVREISALPVYPAATIGYPGIAMPEMGMTGGMPIAPVDVAAGEPPNEKGKSRLDHLQNEMSRRGLRAFAHERDGAVVEEILAAAKELSVQLIVMGSHGHGSIYNLLVGSVTEGVLKAARRPILLVPAPSAAK